MKFSTVREKEGEVGGRECRREGGRVESGKNVSGLVLFFILVVYMQLAQHEHCYTLHVEIEA